LLLCHRYSSDVQSIFIGEDPTTPAAADTVTIDVTANGNGGATVKVGGVVVTDGNGQAVNCGYLSIATGGGGDTITVNVTHAPNDDTFCFYCQVDPGVGQDSFHSTVTGTAHQDALVDLLVDSDESAAPVGQRDDTYKIKGGGWRVSDIAGDDTYWLDVAVNYGAHVSDSVGNNELKIGPHGNYDWSTVVGDNLQGHVYYDVGDGVMDEGYYWAQDGQAMRWLFA
jgi:hypothetical protein